MKKQKQLEGDREGKGKIAEIGRTQQSQPENLNTESMTSTGKELVPQGEDVDCALGVCLENQDEIIVIESEESLSVQKGSLVAMQIVAMCVLILVSLAMVAWYINMQKQKKFTYRLAERHATLPYWRV